MIRALGYLTLLCLLPPVLVLAHAGARTPLYLWIGAVVVLTIAERHDAQA